MKVLVVSDTHGNISNVEEVLDLIKNAGIEAILHCGDYISDMQRLKKLHPEMKVYGVYGNCDGMAYGDDLTKIITLEGVNIFMTHGHKYHVKWGDYEELLIDAAAEGAQAALFGHSHCAYIGCKDEILLLNPGSISCPRDTNNPSYAILDLKDGKIQNATIMQIHSNGEITRHPACNLHHLE